MSKEQIILDSAREAASSAQTWADLSNALFDPEVGLVARAFPTRQAREEFLRTEEYRAIRQLIDDARKRTGLVAGAASSKSGKFIVRLPRTLHAALEMEAAEEGVSLNQLVVTKLAIQMSQLANSGTPEMALIAQAYLEVRNGFSIDRVVADPEMDRSFLRRCRELGLAGTDFDLNWKLFNGRKNKYFTDLPKTKNYTASRKDEFEFSCEMAIRHVQEQVRMRDNRQVSLDKIICDPDLASQFDKIAQKIAPGFSALDYRWVALGVRKAAGRYASKAKIIKLPSFAQLGKTESINASSVPSEQGMYIFRCEDQPLFIGETDNLRHRVERHFDCSKKLGIPDWLYDPGTKTIDLGILPTPDVSSTDRKIIELAAILNYKPLFNYFGAKAA
jgi:hypothetical protein